MNEPTRVVRDLTDDDLEWVSSLYEVCFSRPRSEAKWRWMYFCPDRPAETLVTEIGGQPTGFVGRLFFDVWIDGRRGKVSRGGDFMVEPSFRRVDREWTNAAASRGWERVDASYGFPAEHSFRVAARQGMPMAHLGTLPQWVRWVSGRAVHEDDRRIPSVVGSLAVKALRARSALAVRRAARVVEKIDRDDFDEWRPHFDELAERSRTFARFVLVRDAAYVRWRWIDHPSFDFSVLVARPDDGSDAIDGYVVFAVFGRRGRIVDLLASDEPAALALVSRASEELEGAGVERIVFELNDERPWVSRAMRRLGFLPRGSGPNMTAEARSDWVPGAVRERRSWYVTLADTDLV
jgi:hypothetical protein